VWKARGRIGALALAVVAPLLVFGSVSVHFIASQHRDALVRSIQQTAESAMASAERELADHVGDAEVLAALVDSDLNRGALFESQIVRVMQVRRDRWMNVVVATREGQIYNHDSTRLGLPLPPARFAALDAQVMESGRTHVSGVRARNDRYAEPYITIRVPIRPANGPVTHLLVVVVRAWQLSLAARAAAPPENWRIGITDPDGMIVGRATASDPNDPLIGVPSTLPSDTPAGEVVPIVAPDGQRLYAGLARSRIAVEGGSPVLAQLGRLLPELTLRRATAECRSLRWQKHDEEIAVMAAAASISDWIQDRYRENIRPGRLVQELDCAMAALFVQEAAERFPGEQFEVIRCWTLSGPASASPHGDGASCGARIKEGDVLVNIVIPRLNGLTIENERTWFCGTPSTEQARLWSAAKAANEAAIAAARTGNPVCMMDAAGAG